MQLPWFRAPSWLLDVALPPRPTLVAVVAALVLVDRWRLTVGRAGGR